MATRFEPPAFTNRLLDSLKERMQFPTDMALAAFLGVSPSMLSHVRTGKTRITWNMLSRALDHAGYAVSRDSLLSLLPTDLGEGIRAYDNARVGKRSKVVTDERLHGLFEAFDRALEHYPADELLDALEYHASSRK
jgi:hypothetical protein